MRFYLGLARSSSLLQLKNRLGGSCITMKDSKGAEALLDHGASPPCIVGEAIYEQPCAKR